MQHKKIVITQALLLLLIISITIFMEPIKAITWSDYSTRFTTYPHFDGVSTITQTSDGKIWILWQRSILGYDAIYCNTSSDLGVTWSQEKNLTNVPGSYANTHPTMAQDQNGTIWVIWSSNKFPRYQLFSKTSSDNGESWSQEKKIAFDFGDAVSPSLIAAANGTLWLVYALKIFPDDYEIVYRTSSDLNSWSAYTQITNNTKTDETPSITQTKDGKIWVAWSSDTPGNHEIYYKTYNSSSWSNTTRLTTNVEHDTTPSIVQAIDGTIYVFWAKTTSSSAKDIYYKYSTNNGADWSDEIPFTIDTNVDQWPSATRTSDTRIWVVWTSNRGDQPDGNFDIHYKGSLVGDVTGDGIVDIFDLRRVGLAYGIMSWEPGYDPDADINKDNVIDMRDISLVSKNYGST